VSHIMCFVTTRCLILTEWLGSVIDSAPWSFPLTIYQWVYLGFCMSTDLTFCRSFSLTIASILVKAFSNCNHYENLSEEWCQNNMLTCAISKELWMQLWFPFPTVEVSLIHKVIIRVIVCWKCPRGRGRRSLCYL
jgi:hypothetical protein